MRGSMCDTPNVAWHKSPPYAWSLERQIPEIQPNLVSANTISTNGETKRAVKKTRQVPKPVLLPQFSYNEKNRGEGNKTVQGWRVL